MRVKKLLPNSWDINEEYSEEMTFQELYDLLDDVFNNATRDQMGCWNYKKGFKAYFDGTREKGRGPAQAYRAMFMVNYGFIWPDPECRHLCNNPYCVRPSHLWVGDRKDQQLDSKFEFNGSMLAPRDWYGVGERDQPSVATYFSQYVEHDNQNWDDFINWAYDNGLGNRLLTILEHGTREGIMWESYDGEVYVP